MKLLKYVLTHDSGLAPNPFFGACSLALCTPNHMNARLSVGDWIVGHTTKATSNRLVYAMKLTKVLSMEDYFVQFPEKHPDPYGSIEQQYGDNMYFREGDRWMRLPSAEHNSVDSFRQDNGRRVYLAEGNDHFWYFGANNPMPAIQGFTDKFPGLIRSRQGFAYVRDLDRMQAFSDWLSLLGQSGVLGQPRDQRILAAHRHLISIDPEPLWHDAKLGLDHPQSKLSCRRRLNPTLCGVKGGC
ncbi:hypothetical protein [Pseudomonas syringae]|uniref:Nmad2 family putative nucleotide modification protein n=1 Tax=Pseudomonas syringae TaxID=317 RepID=UPI001BCEFE28|nr:hypothetical protein [Pseudomonas syringae]QVI73562.1 hypothetical protein KHW13_14705 [Pseudomonas syringae]